MVFPGRLSTGCYLCRKRKIKCDDTKPACRRCITHQTECPGYPDAFSFRSYKSGSLNRPRSSDKNDTEATTRPVRKNDTSKTTHQSIRPPPGISLEWQAMSHFFHHYILQVEKSPCRGHLVFLPELYQKRGEHPCLKDALLSVSYLALFKSTGAPIIRVQAYTHYGSALKGLVHELNSFKAAMKEETLVISLCLSMFKDLSDERKDLYNPHVPGIHSLLKSWGEDQLQTKYGREILGWALTHIQIQAIATNQFHYASLPLSIERMDKPDTVYLAGIITSRISKFCESTQAMRQSTLLCNSGTNEALEVQISSLFDDAAGILHLIEYWNSSIPRHWKQQTMSSASPDHLMATSVSQSTHDRWTTCFLAVFYSSQIYWYLEIMNFIMLSDQFNALVRTHLSDVLTSPSAHIHELIDRICYTVTRTLGSVGEKGEFNMLKESKLASGYTMTWPLWMVINCRFAAPSEAELCRKALMSIGSTMRFDLASFLSKAMDQPYSYHSFLSHAQRI